MTAITPEQSCAWYEHLGAILGEDPDDPDEPDEETDRDRIDDR